MRCKSGSIRKGFNLMSFTKLLDAKRQRLAVERDREACYEAIKAARLIRRCPVEDRVDGATYTSIPMSMWEILQPVIEVESDER